jgi:hypothetical protein
VSAKTIPLEVPMATAALVPLRVQEILKRFHQQQQEFLQPQLSIPPVNDMDGISTDMDGTPTTTTTAFITDDSTPSL